MSKETAFGQFFFAYGLIKLKINKERIVEFSGEIVRFKIWSIHTLIEKSCRVAAFMGLIKRESGGLGECSFYLKYKVC